MAKDPKKKKEVSNADILKALTGLKDEFSTFKVELSTLKDEFSIFKEAVKEEFENMAIHIAKSFKKVDGRLEKIEHRLDGIDGAKHHAYDSRLQTLETDVRVIKEKVGIKK